MHRTYLAVLGTVILVVAGCGDGDKKSFGATPTKAEYIEKADAICSDGKSQAKPVKDQLDALPADARVKDAVPAIEDGLRVTRETLKRLRAVQRPAEDRAALDSYFASLEKTDVAGEQLLAAAKTNDLAKVKQVGAGNPALKADRKRLATQFGFKHCA